MNTVTEHAQMAHPQAQHEHLQTPPAEAVRRSRRPQGRPRALTHPQDVMALVLRQIDAVNATKDELTIALKGLMDRTKQLARGMALRHRRFTGSRAGSKHSKSSQYVSRLAWTGHPSAGHCDAKMGEEEGSWRPTADHE
jgi:hypothetical protein